MLCTRVVSNRMGLLAAALVLACGGDDPTGPEIAWGLRPGVIDFYEPLYD